LNTIASAAANPDVDVDKMERLVAIQRELLQDQRVAAFKAAKARLQGQIPVLPSRGEREVKGEIHNRYALMEDIHEIIQPLMAEHGFSFDWTEEETSPNGRRYAGTLSHEDGHEVTKYITLALDTGGSKNNTQAAGSTASYAQRYLLKMHLNLVTKGEDTDGQVERPDPAVKHAENAKASASIDEKDIPLTWQQGFKERADTAGVLMAQAIEAMQYAISAAENAKLENNSARRQFIKLTLQNKLAEWEKKAAERKAAKMAKQSPQPEPAATSEPVSKEDFGEHPWMAEEESPPGDDDPPVEESGEEWNWEEVTS